MGVPVQDREVAHETKILEVIRTRLREARRARMTGKLVVEIQCNKGGPGSTHVYTEIGVVYKILEQAP